MLFDPNPTTKDVEQKAPAYVYPPPLAPGAGAKPSSNGQSSSILEHLWASDAGTSGPQPVNEEQILVREERARKEGREEALAQSRVDFERLLAESNQKLAESVKQLAAEKQVLAQAVGDFARERENYFQRVEAEVVGLAVAIARKILHREAQVDPLLLAGVVRVGLDKIAAGTRVRLRVHPDQVQAWQDFFAQQPGVTSPPELMGDPALEPGHCLLETELGSTDLTLETQLKEIEQGFFDLLAQKPKEQ